MNEQTATNDHSRLGAFWDYLLRTSPKTTDDDRLQARWLAALSIAVILVGFFSISAEKLIFSDNSFYQGSNGFVALSNIALTAILFLVNRWGYHKIAAKLFVVLVSATIFAFALPEDATRDTDVLNSLLVAVVFSRLFSSTRFTLGLIFVHFIGMLAFRAFVPGNTLADSAILPVATGSLLVLLAFHYRSMIDVRRFQATQNELSNYASRLDTLRQIEQEILAAGTLQSTAEAVIDHLHEILPNDQSSILLIDWENTEATALAVGGEQQPSLKPGMRVPLSDLPNVGALLNHDRYFLIDDLSHSSDKFGGRASLLESGIRSVLSVPLTLEGDLIGTLNVESTYPHAYQERHIEIAEEIASHLALALRQTQLIDEAQQRAGELEVVRQVSLSLISSADLDAVLKAVLKATIRLNPAAWHARVFLFENQQLTMETSLVQTGQRSIDLPSPRPNGITSSVARRGEAAIIPDVQNDPNFHPQNAAWEGALVSLPLKINTRVVGVMNIQYAKPRRFEMGELRLMKLLGDQAAIAIENARLYEAEKHAHKRTDSLLKIVHDAASQLSLKEMLQNVLDQCAQIVPFVSGSILTFDEETSAVMAFTGLNSKERSIDDSLDLLKTSPILKQIRRTQKAKIIADTAEEVEWVKTPKGKFIRSWLGVPIVARQETIGLISLDSDEAHSFTSDQLQWVQALADEIAVIIQNARLYEQVQTYAAELEARVRQRTQELEKSFAEMEAFAYSMAHDLRAPLRATEGFSAALLEDFGQQLGTEGQEYTRRILNASRRMDQLISDLLEYSRLSRADMHLQSVELFKSVDEVCTNLENHIQESQAEIEIEVGQHSVIAHPLTMLQVITNLISNAIKFVAPGTRPRVTILARPKGELIRLEVSDNGIGIHPENHDRIFQIFERLHGIENYPGTGIGLAIVHRGVERMQGCVGFESQIGEGSTFWVELPRAEE